MSVLCLLYFRVGRSNSFSLLISLLVPVFFSGEVTIHRIIFKVWPQHSFLQHHKGILIRRWDVLAMHPSARLAFLTLFSTGSKNLSFWSMVSQRPFSEVTAEPVSVSTVRVQVEWVLWV